MLRVNAGVLFRANLRDSNKKFEDVELSDFAAHCQAKYGDFAIIVFVDDYGESKTLKNKFNKNAKKEVEA